MIFDVGSIVNKYYIKKIKKNSFIVKCNVKNLFRFCLSCVLYETDIHYF